MDITAIFTQAKEDMMEYGKQRPLLFAEYVTGIDFVVFADFPYLKTLDKQKALFNLGRKLGKEHIGDELRQLCFVCETWYVERENERDLNDCIPSEAPDRKEAIAVIALDIEKDKTLKSSFHRAEIIRHGEIVDLLPCEEVGDVHDKLLPAFLAGHVASKMSDAQLLQIIAKSVQEGGGG